MVNSIFAVRWKDDRNLNIDRFLAVKVKLGEPKTVTLERLITNQMRLFVPERLHHLKNYNTTRVKCRHAKVTKDIGTHDNPITINVVSEDVATPT